jgi:HlyD family secretion protein
MHMKQFLQAHKKQLLLFLILLLAAGIAAYQYTRPRETALTLYGNVDIRQVSLAFNANERIQTVNVEEGDHVNKGDVLATLNTEPLELAIAATNAQIAQQRAVTAKMHNGSRPEEITEAEASVHSAAANYENNQLTYQRMQQLYAQGAISRQELDNAEASFKMTAATLQNNTAAHQMAQIGYRQEDIDAADAQLQQLQENLRTQEYNLSQATLIAPQDGVIRSRLLEPGDMASSQKPVFLLGLDNVKWVRAYIPEDKLSRIYEGLAAQVYIDSQPDTPLTGQVGYISDTAEFTPKTVQTEELRSSLVYEVRIYVTDEQNVLRMGMPATIRF